MAETSEPETYRAPPQWMFDKVQIKPRPLMTGADLQERWDKPDQDPGSGPRCLMAWWDWETHTYWIGIEIVDGKMYVNVCPYGHSKGLLTNGGCDRSRQVAYGDGTVEDAARIWNEWCKPDQPRHTFRCQYHYHFDHWCSNVAQMEAARVIFCPDDSLELYWLDYG